MYDDLLREIWKSIENYENLYEVSNFGNVRSVFRQGTKGCYLKQDIRKDGYLQTHLVKNGKMKNYLVHRLVAGTFIDNPENKEQVNHKDGNKSNNCVTNLEWATRSENIKHAYKNNLNKNKIKVQQIDENNNIISIFDSIREAGRITNINQSHIVKCCKGKIKKAGGYKWRYADER